MERSEQFKQELELALPEVEEKITQWALLLTECKIDLTRFEIRVKSIDELIQVRHGLKYMLAWIDEK